MTTSDEAFGDRIIEAALGRAVDLRVALVDNDAIEGASPSADRGYLEVDRTSALSTDRVARVLGAASVVLVSLISTRRWSPEDLACTIQVLTTAAGTTQFVLLLPDSHLRSGRFAALRRAVAECQVEWVIWTRDGLRIGVPAVLVVLRASPEAATSQPTRMANGAAVRGEELLERVRACARRAGGAVDDTLVTREPLPLHQPWTWDILSGAYARRAEDLGVLGPLVELGEFIEAVWSGLRGGRGGALAPDSVVELEDGIPVPDGYVGLISGSQIRQAGLLPTSRAVLRSAIGDKDLIRADDLLIPHVSLLPLRIVVANDDMLPAAHLHSVLRVRLRESLSPQRRRILLEYLCSSRFAAEFARSSPTLNGAVQVSSVALRRTHVPEFDESLIEAMTELSSTEARFRRWADEVFSARSEFFSSTTFATSLPVLLERSRDASDQVAAASDVVTLDGRIRHRFPHPLAYRFESIQQFEHGPDRVREILACAE